MLLQDKKREYIDKQVFKILELFEVTRVVNSKTNESQGSISHVIPTMIEGLDIYPLFEATSLYGETVAIKETDKEKCISLNINNYKDLKKLLDTIYEDRNVNSLISFKFLEEKVTHWLLKTFRANQAEQTFSTYLLNVMEESIEEYKIHFPILYLHIGKHIKVGNVELGFFTKEYIDFLSIEFAKNNPEKESNPFERMRKELQGKVYVSYIVKAEREKAKEIALRYCALAIDILKICSDTADLPNYNLSFDIDQRTKENFRNEVILVKVKESNSFTIDYHRTPGQHQIYDQEWDRILKRHFSTFNDFLLSLSNDNSELQNLIVNSIRRYGNAISNHYLHQRILELFTIMESLLLPNSDANILESVGKYCSKLVAKDAKNREKIIALLSSMYKVRSQLVHHGKELQIVIDDLKELQTIVRFLLVKLIQKTSVHRSKNTVLKEIDDAILNAY